MHEVKPTSSLGGISGKIIIVIIQSFRRVTGLINKKNQSIESNCWFRDIMNYVVNFKFKFYR